LNKDFFPEKITLPVLVLIGPTAIGKTELSLQLSETFDCEIISVDSMQVHRFMDIGTAKIPLSERRSIPHHLIDIVNPDEQYDAVQFARDCLRTIKKIHKKSSIPLLTGGTGLYLRSLKDGFFAGAPTDLEIRNKLLKRLEIEGVNVLHSELLLCDRITAEKLHQNDTSRIVRALEVYLSTGTPLSTHQKNQPPPGNLFSKMLTIGLTCDRTRLYERINQRSATMLEDGLEGEVSRLLNMGYTPNLKSMQSIGYRHMVQYLAGNWSEAELRVYLARDTRRYAKRQYTWFNRDQSVVWFNRNDNNRIISFARSWLQENYGTGSL